MLLSQACENNKTPILDVLNSEFTACKTVLEIGSGTGQHAQYFSHYLPHLSWQPSERSISLKSLTDYCQSFQQQNLLPPIVLDVEQPWELPSVDAIFTANTLHIMGWPQVEIFFQKVARQLNLDGICCIYGPFNYRDDYTSDSNRQFDHWLKARDANSAIRDFEQVDQLAKNNGLILQKDYPMPAHNRCIVWKKLN